MALGCAARGGEVAFCHSSSHKSFPVYTYSTYPVIVIWLISSTQELHRLLSDQHQWISNFSSAEISQLSTMTYLLVYPKKSRCPLRDKTGRMCLLSIFEFERRYARLKWLDTALSFNWLKNQSCIHFDCHIAISWKLRYFLNNENNIILESLVFGWRTRRWSAQW